MSFLQNPTQLSSDPLDQMPFGNNHPFPVEIWRHIFALMEDPIQYSINGAQTYQYFFSEEEESHLWSMDPLLPHSVFKTRRSIILTCRSWYYIGISVLWSHLLLKGGDIERDTISILKSLKHHPTFGLYVTQISIFRLHPHNYDMTARHIPSLLPFLPQLSVIHGPVRLLESFPSSLRVGSAVIRAIPMLMGGLGPIVQRIPLKDVFWLHCQTLSLASPLGALSYAMGESQVVFPSLISLRLCGTESQILRWIISAWNFPCLKDFSMIMPKNSQSRTAIIRVSLAPLLDRVKLTLKRIQVPIMFVYSSTTENNVELPRLTELHLTNMYEERKNILTDGHQVIKAPNLRRFVFYAYSDLPRNEDYWSRIYLLHSRFWNTFPSVKEIDIVATKGHWVAPGQYNPYDLVAKIEEIQRLVNQKFTVRVVLGTKGAMETFPEGDSIALHEKLAWSARLVIGRF